VAQAPISPEFRFGLGHTVLEFIATIGGRHQAESLERLAKPRDLGRWFSQAGVASNVRADERLLDSAHTLREAIYRTVNSTRHGKTPDGGDIEMINRWAATPTLAPQIGARLRRSWLAADPGRAALASIAREAVELLTGPDLTRIRNCASPSCPLMFIDRSRPGRRRWCSTRCSNPVNTAAYRRRRGSPPRSARSR
jgi:predicted RNA-binding Zn ribbon-like protein